ncbi:hypothetical protein [Streptantibioticus silvisoli]|uniref:Secreted protein n=1 Tax=Streptantibioticus silvisoli TaxID=2705255 RepID=A0ABT6W4Z1_9ACTN|nr:hypothetical protein [Streptantibioticus silvisoli]MDI5965812.1 hypothetical protein [Streptantibioticus silvisoli]
MNHTRTIAAALAATAVLALAGCSADKTAEPFKDSPRNGTNNNPAEVITMPDGFNNIASKCDGPNRVYVTYHGDDKYGAVAVVPNDPRCTTAAKN